MLATPALGICLLNIFSGAFVVSHLRSVFGVSTDTHLLLIPLYAVINSAFAAMIRNALMLLSSPGRMVLIEIP